MPLNLKVTLIIILGIALAVASFSLLTKLENYMAEYYYTNDTSNQTIQDETFLSLENYIEDHHVKGTDTKKLNKWLKENKYTSLSVYDRHNVHYDRAWHSIGLFGNEIVENESTISTEAKIYPDGERLDYNFTAGLYRRVVEFDDQEYYVKIDVFKEEEIYNIMGIAKLVVGFMLLLATVLIYNSRIIHRILDISVDVTKVSTGDLEWEITHEGNDEITRMAKGIEKMRKTLLQKLANEKEAWEANSQLITSMSHDIRTPLTSMIGYLDIIEGKKYTSQDEMDSYVSACREKAFQLKDLSDKLFQYFLVYGRKENHMEMEFLDGDILFQQLLTEHTAELLSYGFKVQLEYNVPEVSVFTDVSYLRRLFDNLFSNIMKYANKKERILIKAFSNEEGVEIFLENYISAEARLVESTCIGVKTCEKIVADLGGELSWNDDDGIYFTKIFLPTAPAFEESSLDDEDSTIEELLEQNKNSL